jgi:hypothetical protein
VIQGDSSSDCEDAHVATDRTNNAFAAVAARSGGQHNVALAWQVDDHLAGTLIVAAHGDLVHRRRYQLADHRIPPEVGVDDRHPLAGSARVRVSRIGGRGGLRCRGPRDLDGRRGRDPLVCPMSEPCDAVGPGACAGELAAASRSSPAAAEARKSGDTARSRPGSGVRRARRGDRPRAAARQLVMVPHVRHASGILTQFRIERLSSARSVSVKCLLTPDRRID